MKKQTIRDAFNDANIADTRHFMLEDGLRTLHRAFAECDTYNRAKIIEQFPFIAQGAKFYGCLLYTSPSPRDGLLSRMPSSA